MAVPIETIPDEELRKDYADSVEDARNCDVALAFGHVFTKDGTSIKYRRDQNKKFIVVIAAEWRRRHGVEIGE
jgi:uncharacterized caspase-like protein